MSMLGEVARRAALEWIEGPVGIKIPAISSVWDARNNEVRGLGGKGRLLQSGHTLPLLSDTWLAHFFFSNIFSEIWVDRLIRTYGGGDAAIPLFCTPKILGRILNLQYYYFGGGGVKFFSVILSITLSTRYQLPTSVSRIFS